MLLLLSFPLWLVGAPTKEYAHPYSMMHRRLTTAGIEVAPHYHQLLVLEIPGTGSILAAAGNTCIFFKMGKKHTGTGIGL